MPLVHALIEALQSLIQRGRLAISAMVLLTLVAAGPFDTLTRLTLAERFIYWSGIVVFSLVMATFVTAIMRPVVHGMQQWQESLAKSAAMALVFTPAVYGWTHLLVPPRGESIMGFHWFFVYVTLISMIIFHARGMVARARIIHAFRQSESGSVPAISPDDKVVIPRLLRRIAPADPGPVIRIEALDLFVTVVTSRDQYRLRMRFADAVDQMDGVDGLITHRSHWITPEEVVGQVRMNGRQFLNMSCGTSVPVSRKYYAEIMANALIAAKSARHR